jgi:RNA polymerase sigma factor
MLSSFLKDPLSSSDKSDELEKKVMEAQRGNVDVRNELIQQYNVFATKVASKVFQRSIDTTNEEFNVVLVAFNEAITTYTARKGSSFSSYLDLIIRRRMSDYIYSDGGNRDQLLLSHLGKKEKKSSPHDKGQKYNVIIEKETFLRQQEIEHYKEKLQEYRIDLLKLPKLSFKYNDQNISAIEVARTLVDNEELRLLFIKKKKLPVKDLVKHIKAGRKTIINNQSYIIALVLLFIEDYEYLQKFIS